MRRTRRLFLLIAALLMGAMGALLLADRPGLRVEYFALTPSWDARPVFTAVGEPQLGRPEELSDILVSTEIFSVRWRGWIVVPEGGVLGLSLEAHRGAYLRVDDELVVDTRGVFGSPRGGRSPALEAGTHSIEIGLYNNTGGPSRLATYWTVSGGEREVVPAAVLWSRRPLPPQRLLRAHAGALPARYRLLLGALLALASAAALRHAGRAFEPRIPGLRTRLRSTLDAPGARSALSGLFLVALFAATWLAVMPHTAGTFAADDAQYLYAATFDQPVAGWFLNRHVHVFLLKLFGWLCSGDALLGSRTYWAFLAAVTVTSLAVAVRSLGPGLQLRTLAVVLFLLLSQTHPVGNIGGAFPDYSAMMFVAAATAVYLHMISQRGKRGGWEWHAVAIGILTLAAFKSKETGIILLWLPFLFLWSDGKLDLQRFRRRMGYWLAGALAAYLVLMTLEWRLLGDFWYSLRPDNLAAAREVNVGEAFEPGRSIARWLGTVWGRRPGETPGHLSLRNLWLLVAAATVAAQLRGKRMEMRLLHLMPFLYLFMLIVVHSRAPHPFSTRYLYPILPLCALLGGALVSDCGLESLSWRNLRSARTPLLVALLAGLVVFFGPGVELSRRSLARDLAVQRGDLILYPWRVFEEELRRDRPQSIALSPDLYRRYGMVGRQGARQIVARLFLGREDLRVWQSRTLTPGTERAIASRRDLEAWNGQLPGLAATARSDPSGQLLLVRPREVSP